MFLPGVHGMGLPRPGVPRVNAMAQQVLPESPGRNLFHALYMGLDV